jgi:hypothetical protein
MPQAARSAFGRSVPGANSKQIHLFGHFKRRITINPNAMATTLIACGNG